MRSSLAVFVSIISLSVPITVASSDASSPTLAVARPHIGADARRATRGNAQNREMRSRFAATMCTMQASNAFVGLTNNNDVAGGDQSAVVAGGGNEACDADSGIGAGGGNVIGSSGGFAEYSFISAGYYNSITGGDSAIGAGAGNSVTGDFAFVGAGGGDASGMTTTGNTAAGESAFVGAGEGNGANAIDSSVVGGNDNGASGSESVVGGGGSNTADGNNSFIGAGGGNTVAGDDGFVGAGEGNEASGKGSFVGAGGTIVVSSGHNVNTASGEDSFIGAGGENSVASNDSFVGSGFLNSIGSNGLYSIVTGGYGNAVSSQYGTIDGGEYNTVGGNFATIPGGAHDKALGTLSFAAGYQAQANHNGSFVWSDYVSGSSPLTDTNVDQFVVRATGGTFVYSSEGLASGVKLASGSGTWSSLSDRNAKTAILPVDDEAILAKVAALPVNTWQYKTEKSVRHVGPMAQDFYSAFGVGEDDRHITSIDEDGVALAAIKALDHENGTLRTRVAALEARDSASQRAIRDLRAELRRFETFYAGQRAR